MFHDGLFEVLDPPEKDKPAWRDTNIRRAGVKHIITTFDSELPSPRIEKSAEASDVIPPFITEEKLSFA